MLMNIIAPDPACLSKLKLFANSAHDELKYEPNLVCHSIMCFRLISGRMSKEPMSNMQDILKKAARGERLSYDDGLTLLKDAPFLDLGSAADSVRKKLHPDCQPITFCIDRNVNYTNVCDAYCTFCAF